MHSKILYKNYLLYFSDSTLNNKISLAQFTLNINICNWNLCTGQYNGWIVSGVNHLDIDSVRIQPSVVQPLNPCGQQWGSRTIINTEQCLYTVGIHWAHWLLRAQSLQIWEVFPICTIRCRYPWVLGSDVTAGHARDWHGISSTHSGEGQYILYYHIYCKYLSTW